jgi:hypothetical protein
LIPSHSLAVVVLTASKENRALEIHRLAMKHFLPAFDKALIDATEDHMAGKWVSDDNKIELHIRVSDGVLYATHYVINGTDALATLNNGEKTDMVSIWSLGNDEFR